MDNKQESRAVGIFSSRLDIEDALLSIKSTGFPMDKISVVKHNADKDDKVAGVEVQNSIDNKASQGAVAGAITGGAIGGTTGLLVGLGALTIPGVGPGLLTGAAATAIATTLAGTAIGAGGASLLGALIGLGIPDNEAKVYSDLLDSGSYLVVVDASQAQIRSAGEILARKGIHHWQVYGPHPASVPEHSSRLGY
jgi:hypothetical protein